MTYTEVKLTFNSDFPKSVLRLYPYSNKPIQTPWINERWVDIRTGKGEVAKGTPTSIPGERSAINCGEAINLDYNPNIYDISVDKNVLFIKCKVYGILFETDRYSIPKAINVEFKNYTDPLFEILKTEFEKPSSNACDYVKLSIRASDAIKKITSPLFQANINAKYFSFDWLRDTTIKLTIENYDGKIASQNIVFPNRLNAENFKIDVVNTPSDAAVEITDNTNYKAGSPSLFIQYSLDNINWQKDNVYNGIGSGEYILYIKDYYGCQTNKKFKVDGKGINTPFFYISKSNSIRFAERISWQNCSNYKTDENTLSCEVDVDTVYQEIQQFQTCDIITTQFKSNYNQISVTLIQEGKTEIEIPFEKRSNNIGIKDLRDGILIDLKESKSGIYFTSGSIYDYDTGAKIRDYVLNGALPEYAKKDQFIRVGSSWFKILEVLFDEIRNAEVIVISNVHTGGDTPVKVGCLYNRFSYETYEFTIDFSKYVNQYVKVKIDNNDSYYTNRVLLSELLYIKERQEDTVEILYKNDANNDIDYSTGIEHKIRIPITSVNGKINEESDTHKMDTKTILLSSTMYEVDEFVFEPVTKEIMRKITYALSHPLVKINGVSYVKNGSFDIDGPLDKSNLYVVKIDMIKSESYFNDKSSDDDMDVGGELIEIPGLIETNMGYVKY